MKDLSYIMSKGQFIGIAAGMAFMVGTACASFFTRPDPLQNATQEASITAMEAHQPSSLNIRIPENEAAALSAAARRQGRTKSEIVREFLRTLPPAQEPKAGKQAAKRGRR